jgi:hypothetical protein
VCSERRSLSISFGFRVYGQWLRLLYRERSVCAQREEVSQYQLPSLRSLRFICLVILVDFKFILV